MSPAAKKPRKTAKRAAKAPPAVEIHDLAKVYGQGDTEVRALDGVDLEVAAGEMVAIMGPSGSGKSTMLHLLGALETPTSGTIALAGRHFEGLDDNELTLLRRDGIGFVFQFFNLLPSLSAEENVLLPALIAGRRDEALRKRARSCSSRCGWRPRADHLPSELSGGEQQRVSIARALLMEPELVLADEPTGNLDSTLGGGGPRPAQRVEPKPRATRSSWSPTTPAPPRSRGGSSSSAMADSPARSREARPSG